MKKNDIKIVKVEPILMKGTRWYKAWNFVRIYTEQGIEGIGEGFSWGGGNIDSPQKIFEEPVDANQPERLKPIADSTSIPIAVGENICTREEAKKVFDTEAIEIIQPELGTNGGILESFKVSAMAEVYNVKVSTHNWCGPIVTLAASHLCAAIPNLLYQEYASTAPEDSWEKEFLEPPIRIENGEIVLSDSPGLGVKINEKLLEDRRL